MLFDVPISKVHASITNIGAQIYSIFYVFLLMLTVYNIFLLMTGWLYRIRWDYSTGNYIFFQVGLLY